jgi:dihydrofolate reductase
LRRSAAADHDKGVTVARLSFDITMSLDGFITGPDPGPEQPLGAGGERLHEWVYSLASWREAHGQEGGEVNADSEVVAETVGRAGSTVMGRGMFGGGEGPWGDDPWQGWWGDEPPFHMPVFVLTQHPREPLALAGTTFTFVTDGIESALEQAKAAAGDKDVALAGGADVFQQYLRAGLVDDLQIHIAPLLLGGGTRLFDNLGGAEVGLETDRVIESPAVTHIRYRVVR